MYPDKTSDNRKEMPIVDVHLLPANEGDFIWLHYGVKGSMHNIIIDGGTKEAAGLVAQTFKYILTTLNERIDAVFITHSDADHIQGIAKGMEQLPSGLFGGIDAIYMNTHRAAAVNTSVPIDDSVEAPENQKFIETGRTVYSPGQVISFMEFLEKKKLLSILHEYTIAGQTLNIGGAKLYVISPLIEDLKKYVKEYEKKAPKSKTEIYGSEITKMDTKNLSDYKESDLLKDSSIMNRASIAFLFCLDDIKILLTGDAAADACMTGIYFFPDVIGEKCPVNAFKIAHHGSNYNTSGTLLETFPTDCYLLSTNGKNPNGKADVPHRATIAQMLKSKSTDTIHLVCNYDWWSATYANKYFTEMDKEQYLRTGVLIRENLLVKNYNAGNGVTIYGYKS